MKTLIILLVLSFSFNCFAQDQKQSKKVFLRIFNAEGKKIAKGKILEITDSTLTLGRNKKTVKISFSDIETIKTKHSFGNNVLIGTGIGVGVFGILGASTSSDSGFLQYSEGEGLAVGALVGAPLGASVGALTGIFKNSKFFEINGNENQWKAFKALFPEF